MKLTRHYAAVGAILGLLSAAPARAEEECQSTSSSIKQAIDAKPSELLQIVESRVSASPACSCEIVKTAIEATQADAKTIASIVEVASSAAPDKMRLIAQCALAVAPDALSDVQSVLAKLDPNRGDGGNSSKDAKDAKQPQVADTWNPLDFPGDGPVGPRVGDPGGYPTIPPGPPTGFPPIITPPISTRPNFVAPPIKD